MAAPGSDDTDIAVVGGGIIGLACAWQLARHAPTGTRLNLIAPATLPSTAASFVAAGMLGPAAEAQFGESDLTELALDSAARWKTFAADLEADSGLDIGYDQSPTLTVALDPSDRAALDHLLTYQQSLGLTAHRRNAGACRALVPALAPAICGGVETPADHRVDNRALLGALGSAAKAAAVTFIDDTVAAIEPGPMLGLTSGRRIGATRILLAAGIGLRTIAGLGQAGLPDLRPVKGTILRLGPSPTSPSTASFLPLTVRGLVRGRSIYLVPRPDGTVVVGATVEERGDTEVAAGAVHQLLDDARALLPGLDDLTLLETGVGLRPATPDHRPCLGWTRLDGVAVATGHFRHGFLLAPVTAAAAVALFAGGAVPPGFTSP
jgi:glycine oxidase